MNCPAVADMDQEMKMRMACGLIYALAVSTVLGQFPPEKLLARIPEGVELVGKPRKGPDGIEVPTVSRPVWSADGLQVAYIGHRDGKSFPVVGETVGESFHYIDPPVFGTKGTQVAFRVGNCLGPTSEKWWLWIDGKKQFPEDWIGSISACPDGKQWAYWTQPGAKLDSTGAYARSSMVLAFGTKRSKKYDDAEALTAPVFSSDGKQVATPVAKTSKHFALVFGAKEELVGKGAPMVDTVVWRPDGKELAIVEMDISRGSKGPPKPWSNLVIRAGSRVLGKDYESAGMPVYSRDGKTIAYKVARGELLGVALNEDANAKVEWAFVDEIALSSDGKRLAFSASKDAKLGESGDVSHMARWQIKSGGWQVVVDGKPGDRFDAIAYLVWSPNGKQLARAVRKDKSWHVVVGETTSDPFDDVGPPRFSDDGKSVGFGAQVGREMWWKVITLP